MVITLLFVVIGLILGIARLDNMHGSLFYAGSLGLYFLSALSFYREAKRDVRIIVDLVGGGELIELN